MKQNLSQLKTDSVCDNVYLEHRLALELHGMGLIEHIYPIMIGELAEGESDTYGPYELWGEKWASDEVVTEVEMKVNEHLEREGLGAPLEVSSTPRSTLKRIMEMQGHIFQGSGEVALSHVCADLLSLKSDTTKTITSNLHHSSSHNQSFYSTPLKTDRHMSQDPIIDSPSMKGETAKAVVTSMLQKHNEELRERLREYEIEAGNNAIRLKLLVENYTKLLKKEK
eukprot:CAMPEP_0182433372 /NCGR_PEP_ID=MMETSP1167-20130531/62718_1 /TAXON_ID=2988 /ORGANISM="Mallomonas Sp, Strain CCMP3275" /LENGTH=224 /DNA_ID=CAMNT_0024621973 /DNA_START=299 /DNA_END=970 /DNA_ORIENTATION=-